MKRKMSVLMLAAFMTLAYAYGQDKQPMIGENAPDFNLKDLSGDMVTLSKLKGNFVVVHFAASW